MEGADSEDQAYLGHWCTSLLNKYIPILMAEKARGPQGGRAGEELAHAHL